MLIKTPTKHTFTNLERLNDKGLFFKGWYFLEYNELTFKNLFPEKKLKTQKKLEYIFNYVVTSVWYKIQILLNSKILTKFMSF